MKVSLHFSLFALIILTVSVSCNTPRTVTTTYQPAPSYSGPVYQQEEVNSDVFYNELRPYGRWVEFPQYGQVWVCNQPGFAPYQSAGRWAYTEYGWTWVSDYSWGWAPFHYGRWVNDPMYGWAWIPGNEWAPAWVSWRHNNSYYGWAPLGPDWSYSNGYGENIPYDQWCFVPNRYMCNADISHYYINRGQNVTIINNTTIINTTNIYRGGRYMSGPDRYEVERNIGRKVNTITVNNSTHPGNQLQGNNFNIYRPVVKPIHSTKVSENPVTMPVSPTTNPVRPNTEPTRPVGNDQPNTGRPIEELPGKPVRPVRPHSNEVNPTPAPTRPVGNDQPNTGRPIEQVPTRPIRPAANPGNTNSAPTRPVGYDQPNTGRPVNQMPTRPVRSNVEPVAPAGNNLPHPVNPGRPDRSNVRPEPAYQPGRNPGRAGNSGNGNGNMPSNNVVKHPVRTVTPTPAPPRVKAADAEPRPPKAIREEKQPNRRD